MAVVLSLKDICSFTAVSQGAPLSVHKAPAMHFNLLFCPLFGLPALPDDMDPHAVVDTLKAFLRWVTRSFLWVVCRAKRFLWAMRMRRAFLVQGVLKRRHRLQEALAKWEAPSRESESERKWPGIFRRRKCQTPRVVPLKRKLQVIAYLHQQRLHSLIADTHIWVRHRAELRQELRVLSRRLVRLWLHGAYQAGETMRLATRIAGVRLWLLSFTMMAPSMRSIGWDAVTVDTLEHAEQWLRVTAPKSEDRDAGKDADRDTGEGEDKSEAKGADKDGDRRADSYEGEGEDTGEDEDKSEDEDKAVGSVVAAPSSPRDPDRAPAIAASCSHAPPGANAPALDPHRANEDVARDTDVHMNMDKGPIIEALKEHVLGDLGLGPRGLETQADTETSAIPPPADSPTGSPCNAGLRREETVMNPFPGSVPPSHSWAGRRRCRDPADVVDVLEVRGVSNHVHRMHTVLKRNFNLADGLGSRAKTYSFGIGHLTDIEAQETRDLLWDHVAGTTIKGTRNGCETVSCDHGAPHVRTVPRTVSAYADALLSCGRPSAPSPSASAAPSPLASAAPSPLASAAPSPLASAAPSPLASAAPSPLASAAPEGESIHGDRTTNAWAQQHRTPGDCDERDPNAASDPVLDLLLQDVASAEGPTCQRPGASPVADAPSRLRLVPGVPFVTASDFAVPGVAQAPSATLDPKASALGSPILGGSSPFWHPPGRNGVASPAPETEARGPSERSAVKVPASGDLPSASSAWGPAECARRSGPRLRRSAVRLASSSPSGPLAITTQALQSTRKATARVLRRAGLGIAKGKRDDAAPRTPPIPPLDLRRIGSEPEVPGLGPRAQTYTFGNDLNDAQTSDTQASSEPEVPRAVSADVDGLAHAQPTGTRGSISSAARGSRDAPAVTGPDVLLTGGAARSPQCERAQDFAGSCVDACSGCFCPSGPCSTSCRPPSGGLSASPSGCGLSSPSSSFSLSSPLSPSASLPLSASLPPSLSSPLSPSASLPLSASLPPSLSPSGSLSSPVGLSDFSSVPFSLLATQPSLCPTSSLVPAGDAAPADQQAHHCSEQHTTSSEPGKDTPHAVGSSGSGASPRRRAWHSGFWMTYAKPSHVIRARRGWAKQGERAKGAR